MGFLERLEQIKIERELKKDKKLKKLAIKEEAAASRAERREAIQKRLRDAEKRKAKAQGTTSKRGGGFIGFLEQAASAADKGRSKVRRVKKATKKIIGSPKPRRAKRKPMKKKTMKRKPAKKKKARRRRSSGYDFSPF